MSILCRQYCTYPTSQGIKINRQNNVVTIKKLKISHEFPGSHIIFEPCFFNKYKRVKNLLNLICNENLDLQFSADYLKNIDDEFIKLCKKANFTGLKFGIESAIPDVRQSVNRFSVTNDTKNKLIKLIEQV